jgi:hypothetical protein
VSQLSTPAPRDSKTDLLEAAKAVVKERNQKAEQAAARRMHPEVRRRVSVLSLLGLAGLLLIVLQPSWLTGPKALPPESPAIVEASVRLAMLREQQRVVDFLKQNGRLPATLAEAGVTVPGLGYQALPQQEFRLFAQAGDSLLVLRSSDSVTLFLGNSLKEIKNRGRP